ncbi:hypothetical protein D9613_007330 [Agrocybe pediades]|uniref:Uncharacterized protein n=1 Tax=Agrocybe pediades TaxID=84607 RepID=A0A8H4QGL2_9AGAR|nr:hypothetical protein D9613_007330 [Agrocybe pediades]
MSSLDDTDMSGPSVSTQKVELAGYLNSNMLTMFLMGIYTIVYCWTFYTYLHSKLATHRKSILGVITVIYVSSVVPSVIFWYQTVMTFIINGDNMDDAFDFMYNSPSFLDTINDTCQDLVIILADGLLMWRCYLVWTGGSRYITWIPCVLWIVEGLLAIAIISAQITFELITYTDFSVVLVNALSAALFFTSALTSLVSSLLIAYRIYAVSQLTPGGASSKRRFMNVIDIVVQSSAIYTLSVLAIGIYNAIPFPASTSAEVAVDMVVDYVGSPALVLIGMMPTLMVMRVAMSSSGDDSTTTTTVLARSTAPRKPSTIHFKSWGADFRDSSWDSAVDSGKEELNDESRWENGILQLDRV